MVEPPAKRDSAKNWLRCAKIEQRAVIDAESCRNNSRIPQRRRELWMTFFRQWPEADGPVPPPSDHERYRWQSATTVVPVYSTSRHLAPAGLVPAASIPACGAANSPRCEGKPGATTMRCPPHYATAALSPTVPTRDCRSSRKVRQNAAPPLRRNEGSGVTLTWYPRSASRRCKRSPQ
jgi:hypothetical protein